MKNMLLVLVLLLVPLSLTTCKNQVTTKPQQTLPTQSVTIQSAPTLTIDSGEILPIGIKDKYYQYKMKAEGGKPPYTWSASGLPSYLSLNNATGVISGTPTDIVYKTYSFTVEVTDSAGNRANKEFSLTVYSGDPGAKTQDFYWNEFIRHYEEYLIDAINNNDFSQVSFLLAPGSNIYTMQKKLVADLYSQGIREKLIQYGIQDIKSIGDNSYKLYVDETIAIKYPGSNDFTNQNFSWIYTVVYNVDSYAISDIEKWNKN